MLEIKGKFEKKCLKEMETFKKFPTVDSFGKLTKRKRKLFKIKYTKIPYIIKTQLQKDLVEQNLLYITQNMNLIIKSRVIECLLIINPSMFSCNFHVNRRDNCRGRDSSTSSSACL